MSVVSAQKFNRSPSAVKAMAKREPVFVTERGRTALVILSAEEYERLTGSEGVYASLRMDDDLDVDLEPIIDREPGRVTNL